MVTAVDPDGPAADAGIRAATSFSKSTAARCRRPTSCAQSLSSGDRPALVLVRRGEQNVFVSLPRNA